MSRGRVLMIAHHFPPAGGSGSNRALAFARYLPECGWAPIVVTPGAAWAANRDDRLLDELPSGLRVIRTRSLEPRPAQGPTASVILRPQPKDPIHRRDPSPLHSRASRAQDDTRGGQGASRVPPALRSNLGHLKRFPDAHLGWLPFALAASRRVDYDVAYTSSGPFTSHLVGLLLKRLTRRPWVAELRDGWYRWNRAIFPDYPRWRDVLERRLEAAALKHADRVILVTDRMANAFRRQYERGLPAEHFAVVPNGFDRLQFPSSTPYLPTQQQFDVLHAGALYYGRSLRALLEAARGLVDTVPAFALKFRLTLLGTLDPGAQREVAASGLAERIRHQGQLDHAATVEAMRAADVLLLVANTTPGAEATVPGKLFEYLAVGRPVLAIAPRDSSSADVLNQTGGGWLAPAGDQDAIARVLLEAFQAHEAAAFAASAGSSAASAGSPAAAAASAGSTAATAGSVGSTAAAAASAGSTATPPAAAEGPDAAAPAGAVAVAAAAAGGAARALGAAGGYVPDPREVARFDRRVLTRDLARIFEQASAGAARRL